LFLIRSKHGDVAQLGEHLPCTQGVAGSTPVISTTMLIRDALGMPIYTDRFEGSTKLKGKLYLTETITTQKDVVLVSRYYLAARPVTRKFYIYVELYVLNRNHGTEIGFSQMNMEFAHHVYIKGKRLSDIVSAKLDQVFDTLYD
jgi:hypothetical protein